MVENGFDLLEQKVKKAAETVRRLRQENKDLEEQVHKGRARLQEAEKRLHALEKDREHSGDQAKEVEGLQKELKGLRGERDEIRNRIGRLVELLESLD